MPILHIKKKKNCGPEMFFLTFFFQIRKVKDVQENLKNKSQGKKIHIFTDQIKYILN